jgi:hypothetical protein
LWPNAQAYLAEWRPENLSTLLAVLSLLLPLLPLLPALILLPLLLLALLLPVLLPLLPTSVCLFSSSSSPLAAKVAALFRKRKKEEVSRVFLWHLLHAGK